MKLSQLRRIIPPMRRWLLVFMIVLLPIRGWVGDAMAGEMAGARLAAINSIAVQADSTRDTASFDAHHAAATHGDCHGSASPAAATLLTDAADSECGSCSACQACHTVALAVPAPAAAPVPPHHSTPATQGQPFASAVPARGFKPPIS